MKRFLGWIAVFLLGIGVAVGGYVLVVKGQVETVGTEEEGLEAIRPRNMRISDITPDSFTVEWEVQASVSGYVMYGDTSNSLNLIAQDVRGAVPAVKHTVVVNGLIPGKKYYFWVMSDETAFGRSGRALEVLTLTGD